MTCVEHQSGRGLGALSQRDDLGLDIESDASLARHSSLRIGGTAEYWVEPSSKSALRAVLREAAAAGLPVYVVGLGSNVLFPDGHLDGAVVRLVGDFSDWHIEAERGDRAEVCVGAGCVNAHLVRGLLDEGWVGTEFLRLVPGTFGGAVAMNAGTKEAELAEILADAELMVSTPDGEVVERRLTADSLSLAYRHSDLPEGAIVTGGRIEVQRGDVERARRKMEHDRERRDETQPYKLASAGSTFANPEDDYAGRLIDEAGLKGERVGGARISETHANFFINEDDDATCEDFLRLMALARVRVREKFDIELRPEVTFVGFDGFRRLHAYEQELC
jgi:UDP-N-acetylmuramate dehydrogenase